MGESRTTKTILKQKINVIDLDGTLIPFDSFRTFILYFIKKGDWFIILLTSLRVLRLVTAKRYKYLCLKYLNKKKTNNISIIYERIAEEVFKSISQPIYDKILTHSNNAINVLCSASPHGYVSLVAKKLGWMGYGSYYAEGKFLYLYGTAKKDFIIENFPPSKYDYHFAISDSTSDLELLKSFHQFELVKANL